MTATILRADQSEHETHWSPVGADHTSDSSQDRLETHACLAAAGSDFRVGHCMSDAQVRGAGADQTSDSSGHIRSEIHDKDAAAVGSDLRADHRCTETPAAVVGADHTSDSSHGPSELHGTFAAVGSDRESGSDTTIDAPRPNSSSLSDPLLALAADVLDDAETARIANANRLRQLTRDEVDADGQMRGFGLDPSDPDVARLAAIVQLYVNLEKEATKNLAKRLRRHPLGPWIKAQKGIGDKQAARLLAVIGDPYINEQTGQPRTISQLWSYCGNGDPDRKRAKGMSQAELFALGSPTAKSRVYMIATSCLKAGGMYAGVYRARKELTEGRVHARECKRCGPSGKPAQPGSPWSNAHRHADALRIVGKEILRDLWLEAKRLHEETE
jgi:hypothetical protein